MAEHADKLVLATAFPSWYVHNLYGVDRSIVTLLDRRAGCWKMG
jgi:hypothetical protein